MADSASSSIVDINHPLHSLPMKELVKTMPKMVQDLYADYMVAFDDEGTPGYEERLSVLRHALANAINVQLLQEIVAKLD